MNRIIEYNDDYKEELFKYGNSGVVLIKDKGFVLSSEFKIFTQGNKKLKNDHFMFLDINDNKTLNGIIAVNKEGIVDFKSIEWIENSHNTGIINDLKIIIPEIFKNQINEYHFIYDEQNQLKSYTIKKIG